jgi:dTDP-3-amino-3,4,6-trideoxy-alpha-D-glucose transaminase
MKQMRVRANRFDRLWDACRAEVLEAVDAVGTSGWYILGQEVKSFEKELADYCGTKYAVGCGNGMDALEISLRALGLRPGDRVITTPLSAFATTLAIIRVGGVPVFCDVDEHGLLDLALVENYLREAPGARFLMPVHLYGHVMDQQRLAHLGRRYDLIVIEDAAQAIGGSRNGQAVGAAGRTTCFSFYPTKNLGALGDGGAIVTNDDAIFGELTTLRNYGQEQRYIHTRMGLNSRLDELHAAMLRRAFMPRLPEWTKRRREIAEAYRSSISHNLMTVRSGPDVRGSVWHLFPVMVPAERRESLQSWLRQAGVDADIHYPCLIPHQPAFKSWLSPPQIFGSLTRAEQFASQEVSLPINAYLTEGEVAHVVETIGRWAG